MILLLVLAISPSVVYAFPATVCTLTITDENGNPKVEFTLDETVYIHWTANGEVTITVYGPDGTTVDNEWINVPSSGEESFVPSLGGGIYTVDCTATGSRAIAVGTFLFAVPEVPMGTAMVLVLSLSALVLLKRKPFPGRI